jgi:hypothetical protein
MLTLSLRTGRDSCIIGVHAEEFSKQFSVKESQVNNPQVKH